MKKFLILAVLAGCACGQNYAYAPSASGWATTTTNLIPFGGSATYLPGYTFLEMIPASMMHPVYWQVDDFAFVPGGSGTWSCANVHIGMGHIATPITCPFVFPQITTGVVTSLGSFLDFTVMYSSAIQGGTFSWPLTIDTHSPMNLPALNGFPFIWDGVHDVAFFVTFQNASATGYTTGFRQYTQGIPPSRTYASGFNAAQSTACNGSSALYTRLRVSATPGLHADFTGTPLSGAAPLAVQFTDQSVTTVPGGVTSWAWDVQNDGIDDYFTQNPQHVYNCAGTYTVKLTVTDAANPPSIRLRNNYVSVSLNTFALTTTGGGVGDLTINPVPTLCYPTAVRGYTLVSLLTSLGTVGTGPFGGIWPDGVTVQFLTFPASVGNPIHFFPSPATYPNAGPFVLPPGTFNGLGGVSMDAVEVALSPAGTIVFLSNVARVTF